jgi:hypothetical protein
MMLSGKLEHRPDLDRDFDRILDLDQKSGLLTSPHHCSVLHDRWR